MQNKEAELIKYLNPSMKIIFQNNMGLINSKIDLKKDKDYSEHEFSNSF